MGVLIAITTCKRLSEVQKYIWDYISYVHTDPKYSFVLALDGFEEEYIEFCKEYEIPLIYSDKREGVGLSKNRVLETFPDYDYYFFIEDDVELVNNEIFDLSIKISKDEKLSHLCANRGHEINKRVVRDSFTLEYSKTGGGYFTLYSGFGLKKVGGWNILFAKYKRFGHTEHSYRFIHNNLQDFPFVFSKELNKMFLLFSPQSVSEKNVEISELNVVKEEQYLINQEIKYFPLKTLSKYSFNKMSIKKFDVAYNFTSKNKKRYPLTKGKERRKSLAERHALLIAKTNNPLMKIVLFLKSFWYYPTNNALKHIVKNKLKII